MRNAEWKMLKSSGSAGESEDFFKNYENDCVKACGLVSYPQRRDILWLE